MTGCLRFVKNTDSSRWEEISSLLKLAHAKNKAAGMDMALPGLPTEELKSFVERNNGAMFLAMDDDKIVGTDCVIFKDYKMWCGTGMYAYECLASVHPDYHHQGIYRALDKMRDKYISEHGIDRVLMDTHEKNSRVIDIKEKSGFKKVGLKVFSNHYSVVMVKWMNKAPYPDFVYAVVFNVIRIYRKLRYKPGNVKRFGI